MHVYDSAPRLSIELSAIGTTQHVSCPAQWLLSLISEGGISKVGGPRFGVICRLGTKHLSGSIMDEYHAEAVGDLRRDP